MDLKGIVQGISNRSLDEVNLLKEELKTLSKSRMNICQNCEIFENSTSTCQKSKGGCGCNMKTKVYCTTCKCPQNKW